ncbi:MAG: CoA transferase [Actinomycetota bacterium]|jgi:crotonobetainyl-CoA:carnitine CoA-transferase CaiB-like acyl-CoA transferase
MPGPLEGLAVVDATWGMPGAVTGMLLADYGARVVKVERPGGGPDRRSVTRSAWDRGKWSVEADLSTAEGREALFGLLATADVFLESGGPGRADAAGFGYDAVHGRWPALVYCSISGYGPDGPWRDRPGYDCLVAARLGAMAEQPGHRKGPKFLGHPMIGYGTASLATIGILAALRARRLTGTGQRVDVSLLDGLVAQSSMNWWWNENDVSYLARSGTEKGFGRTRVVTDPFLCADGEWIMIHTGGPGAFKRAMDILGVGEKVRTIPGVEMSVRLDDDEYEAARHRAPEAFKSRPRAEWLKLFHDADVAALPVLRPGEALLDEQVEHAGVVVELDDPVYGRLRQAGPVIRFEKTPAAPPAPAPTVGQHNGSAATGVRLPGYSGNRTPERGGRPLAHALDGLRVLDFSSFFATAYGAKILSDLGADVIKVETPGGDQMRGMADPFEGCQRGKRTIALDLRSPAGLAIVDDLVRSADVVMHNLRPGKAEKLGIGYDRLAKLRPGLIYCFLPGFGSTGPKAHLKSFAPLISGFTGLLYLGAGRGNPPIKRVMGNEDYYNGFLGAVAVLMALEHRAKTGEGQYIESPQLHSSLFAATEQCLDGAGRPVEAFALDPAQMGYGPLYRLYRTAGDGWLCLACVGDRHRVELRTALGVDDLPADDEALAGLLEERFAQLTVEEAFTLLDGHGVPCEIAVPDPAMPDFLWDEWAVETGRVFEQHHPVWGWIREFGLSVHLSDTPGLNKGPSPLLGQHTREILAELGYDAGRIDELVGTVCIQSDHGAKA